MLTVNIADTTRQVLEAAFEASIAHINGLPTEPASATSSLGELRTRLGKNFPHAGIAPEQVIQDLIKDTKGGLLGSGGGRFFGWVIGGSLPSALGADWLASAWDQNAALYACAPAAAVIEEIAGEWLKRLLALPLRASFALTTGCQMAHVTCLAAARYALLADCGWDVGRRGLRESPRIQVLASTERHGSVDRALRLLGIGTDALTELPVGRQGQLAIDALEDTLRERRCPTILVLQAGDLNTGAYDDFSRAVPLAKRFGAWVHVDGAFGLWAQCSQRFRHLLEGVHEADSWAADGHKWLNIPFDCGYAFVADAEAHRNALSHRAPYVSHDQHARDEIDWNPEWSRRARGFPTYAALRELGGQGIGDLVERSCDHAASLVEQIALLPGVEVLWRPTLNQGLVRFPELASGATEADHGRHTDEVIAALVAAGQAFFSGTTWRGKRAMRISVCNWRTTAADISRAAACIKSILAAN